MEICLLYDKSNACDICETLELWSKKRKIKGESMIPQRLQIVLIIAIVIYFVIILYFLKKRALELKYTLIWFVAGAVMLVLVVFPRLMTWIIRGLGIQSNMNGLYIALIAFIIMILMTLTSIVSRLAYKAKTLTQEFAMLEKRVRDLEKKNEG